MKTPTVQPIFTRWRRLAKVATVAVGLFVFASALLLMSLPSRGPSPPVAQPDPLRRCHEVLKRTNQAYALRLESLRQLRARGLTPGNASTVEDEILTAAQKLLNAHGRENAPGVAFRRVALIAPRISALSNKVGISLGPGIVPELIEARLKSPAERSRFADLVAEYQFAETVRAVVTAFSGKLPSESTETE